MDRVSKADSLAQQPPVAELPRPRLGLVATILVAGLIGSRLLGLARDIVIGNVFGLTPSLDAYYAAFRIPDLIFQLLTGAALASALIPTFTSLLAKGNEEDAWIVASAVLNLAFVVTAALAMLGEVLAPWLVPLIAPGFTSEQQALATQLTRIMLLSPIFFCTSAMASGILNGRQHFLLPAIAPWFYNLAIIAGAALLGGALGIAGLAVGVVVGAGLHLLVQIPGLAREGMRYRLLFSLRHPGVREVGRLMLPRVFGLAAVQVNFVVSTILASGLSSGSLAALNIAWPLTMMPLGVFAMTISNAVFPTLATQAALQEGETFRRTLTGSLRLILFLTIPASIGLILLRDPLVVLLYQRGNFTPESTVLVTTALSYYGIGLFAHATLEIVARGFYALKDTRTPVMVGIGAMVLNLLLSLLLVRPLGHGGLALSMSLSTIVEALLLLALLRKRIGGLDAEFVSTLLRIGLASVIMAAAVLGLQQMLPAPVSFFELLVDLAGLAALGGLVYFTLAKALGSPEVDVLLQQIKETVRPERG